MGFEYWWRWQVLVCAIIIYLPAMVCLVMIRKGLKSGNPLSHGYLWIPSWKGMNPKWLLLYRAFAFISMAFILYMMSSTFGLGVFYFYTQWTFILVTVYFAIATIISARGCWMNLPKAPAKADEQTGPLGYLMHIIYQVYAGASILTVTDIVFWCILVPMLAGKEFELTLLIGLVHGANIVFLIIDSSLNNLPFQWFGFTFFAWWSVLYITFQWSIHVYGDTRWLYPFLELATPWAPKWYLGLALFHIPCYGIYIVFMKAMVSSCLNMCPRAYTRLDRIHEVTLQRVKTT